MDLNLKDKVAIVTGASSGVGKAIAFGLAAEGVKVAVNFLKNTEKGLDFTDDANAVVAEINDKFGVEAFAVACDMGVEEQIVAMYDQVEAKLGKIDILVNNAAYLPKGPLVDYTEAEWNYTFQVNVTGVFIACRELVKRLLGDERPGKIVNIASVEGMGAVGDRAQGPHEANLFDIDAKYGDVINGAAVLDYLRSLANSGFSDAARNDFETWWNQARKAQG